MADQVQRLPRDRSTLAKLTTFAALAVLAYTLRAYWPFSKPTILSNVEEGESIASTLNPPIVRKNSKPESYATFVANYSGIRTFYHAHPQAEKLPDKGKELPLLVFIHGLGGSLAQFGPLLNSLTNIAPCFGIDMPGCGLSTFEPKSYEAYTTEALVALYKVAIEQCCTIHSHRNVALIGHSMGCSISALLVATTAEKGTTLAINTMGMVALCPKSGPPTKSEAAVFRRLLSMPDFMLNSLRWLDKRGGTESPSVKRFVGKDAGLDLKLLQLRFNSQFPTAVFKRKALGAIPSYASDTRGQGGMPGKHIWSGVDIPLLMIAGAGDNVCPPDEVAKIVSFLQGQDCPDTYSKQDATVSAITESLSTEEDTDKKETAPKPTSFSGQLSTSTTSSQHSHPIQTVTLPLPASHALIYDHTFYRTVAGLIEDFLSTHISPTLSMSQQLQTLTTTGKWDVKNLAKWQSVPHISSPIDDNRFRALKTLRSQDPTHTPAVFAATYSSEIYAIIDISHDTPMYSPSTLERAGIQYHKFATVSKVPPTASEVADFIALVERLRAELHVKEAAGEPRKAITVHCHYGYNRTGFFLVCYLVEKRGYTVQEAIEEFRRRRPDGIRHEHFLDALFVRYCVGLRQAV
jgi:pimeloyl-ACP methyl ester carboxylesterase/protein-tyrosine phosphatase